MSLRLHCLAYLCHQGLHLRNNLHFYSSIGVCHTKPTQGSWILLYSSLSTGCLVTISASWPSSILIFCLLFCRLPSLLIFSSLPPTFFHLCFSIAHTVRPDTCFFVAFEAVLIPHSWGATVAANASSQHTSGGSPGGPKSGADWRWLTPVAYLLLPSMRQPLPWATCVVVTRLLAERCWWRSWSATHFRSLQPRSIRSQVHLLWEPCVLSCASGREKATKIENAIE